MMLGKIWERYFVREVIKVFLLLLFGFYILYMMIDYSSRASIFRHWGLSFTELSLYYIYTFVQRLDILVPFALLIASIRTMVNINIYREMVALLAGGISLHTILRPFLIIGLFFTLLIYTNTQVFVPYAVKGLRHIEDTHFVEEGQTSNEGAIQSVLLKDQSTLLYQNYDSTHFFFFDTYWIRSVDDIYRIKYLYLGSPPEGKFVDHLVRDRNGVMVQKESFESLPFPGIHFTSQDLAESLIAVSDQSITRLWKQLPSYSEQLTDKKSKILTSYYRKLIIPWLCLFVIIAPAPFCLRFTRQLPTFFIYLCSMLGLISLYLLLDAATIVGKSQVVHPFWALWPLALLLSGFFTWRYVRIR